MNRALVVAVALALTASQVGPVVAQEEGSMRVGLAGGATFTSVGGDDVILGDWRWGAVAGAFFEFRFHRHWALGLDANWTQKGGQNLSSSVTEGSLRTSYLEFPLSLSYRTATRPWELGLYAGIGFGFNLTCSARREGAADIDCNNLEGVTARGSEWSLPLGVVVAYDFGRSSLGLDSRYALGLTDAFKDVNLFNRSMQLIARWTFIL